MPYHSQVNGRVNRLNSRIVPKLQKYLADYPRNSVLYVQRLTYADRLQRHCSTNSVPFRLVPVQYHPDLTTIESPKALLTDGRATTSPHVLQLLHCKVTMHKKWTIQSKTRDGVTNKSSTRRLSMRQQRYTSDSSCTLIDQQWQPLLHSEWRLISREKYCFPKFGQFRIFEISPRYSKCRRNIISVYQILF